MLTPPLAALFPLHTSPLTKGPQTTTDNQMHELPRAKTIPDLSGLPLGVFERPLTLILLQKHRDTHGSRIVIQIGGVYILLSANKKAYFCKSLAIEMGGVSRYFCSQRCRDQGSIWLSWFQTQTHNRRQIRSILATQFPKSLPCPLRVALSRKSQLETLRFGTQFPKSHWPLSFSARKSQRFESQRLQDANATKSQMLAFFYRRLLVPLSPWLSAWKIQVFPFVLLTERSKFSLFCSLGSTATPRASPVRSVHSRNTRSPVRVLHSHNIALWEVGQVSWSGNSKYCESGRLA